ncbi:MAG: SSS family solute:Na+ symporter, partial [Saprospiraceae bacterium]
LTGALISLIMLFINLDVEAISLYTSEFQKLQIFDFELSFTDPTLWVVLIGGLASNIIQYGSDQTVIQRYLTTKDEKSAANGIKIGAWMALPSTLIFFSLGTLLFVHYKVHPELLNPILDKTDAIFPWYIINSLPEGLSGLLIAAVFAASMSSLDSSMNSVATVVTTDYFRRLSPRSNESQYLSIARWVTIIIGVLGTTLGLIMATWGISSLWDQFNLIVGLFAGGLGGIFILGIFSRQANGKGALIGLILSGVIQYLIREYTNTHFLLYAMTGMLASIIIGFLASMVIGKTKADSTQYTYHNL